MGGFISLRQMQAVLSLEVMLYCILKRKVRATQSIPLPNGKRFGNEDLNYGKCRRKYTADGLGTGKVENVR